MAWTIHKIARKIVDLIFEEPGNIISYPFAIIRGACYIGYYRCFRKNVRIEFPFFAFARVRIIGPGTVRIAEGCHVLKNVFKGLTIVTYSDDSSVAIGERCLLGGVTIRSRHGVEIGPRTMTATCLVQDSLFANPANVHTRADKPPLTEASPISIGGNVWLGAESIVLGGCRIGHDSVLSVGAVCSGMEISDYSLAAGNPSKKPLPIDKLLQLKGMA